VVGYSTFREEQRTCLGYADVRFDYSFSFFFIIYSRPADMLCPESRWRTGHLKQIKSMQIAQIHSHNDIIRFFRSQQNCGTSRAAFAHSNPQVSLRVHLAYSTNNTSPRRPYGQNTATHCQDVCSIQLFVLARSWLPRQPPNRAAS
jgi:hypothetical protein